MLPFLYTLTVLVPPTCKSKSKDPDALFASLVPAAFTVNAVNVWPTAFHVWLIVTGAEVAIDPVEITKFLKVGVSVVPNPRLVRAVG